MKISELKAQLEKYPDDMEIVVLRQTHRCGAGILQRIESLSICIDQDGAGEQVIISPVLETDL